MPQNPSYARVPALVDERESARKKAGSRAGCVTNEHERDRKKSGSADEEMRDGERTSQTSHLGIAQSTTASPSQRVTQERGTSCRRGRDCPERCGFCRGRCVFRHRATRVHKRVF